MRVRDVEASASTKLAGSIWSASCVHFEPSHCLRLSGFIRPLAFDPLHCLQLNGHIDSKAASSSLGCSIMSMELQNNALTGALSASLYEDFPLLQTANIGHNLLTGP